MDQETPRTEDDEIVQLNVFLAQGFNFVGILFRNREEEEIPTFVWTGFIISIRSAMLPFDRLRLRARREIKILILDNFIGSSKLTKCRCVNRMKRQ